MALIDEYKQAIQDVLDGRAKPAPRPSELPWSEDKAATMWAAAAAELIAEANAGEALPDTPGTDGTYALQNTVESGEGTLSWASGGGEPAAPLVVTDSSGTLDKTWNQIKDALVAGRVVYATWGSSVYAPLFSMDVYGGEYSVYFYARSVAKYSANDPDGELTQG